MKIISSQHHINWDIVDEKMADLEGKEYIVVPCWEIGEVDGEGFAIMADKHHTMVAAKELGIDVRFEILPEPEGLMGDEALTAHWNDGDWYDVETSDIVNDNFNLIW